MTGPWDSDRDRVQRDFGFRFDFEARGRANFEAGVQAPGRLEGQPVRVEWNLHSRIYRESLSGDAVTPWTWTCDRER